MSEIRVVFTAPRQVQLESFELKPLKEHELRVRTSVTLVSTGTEMTAYTGDFPTESSWAEYVRYPWIAGYSHVGVVEEVGSGVTDIKPGTRVVSTGPHASAITLHRHNATVIPDGVSDAEATFWMLGRTVMNGVRLARIELGETVVIMGAGILGNLAAQYASLCGARPVIVADLSEARLGWLPKMPGITPVVSGESVIDTVSELTGGRLAQVVFEVTGHPAVLNTCFKLARRRARVMVLGSPRGKTTVDFHDEVHRLGLQVIGAHVSTHPAAETPYYEWTPQRNGDCFFRLVGGKDLHLNQLISHRFPGREADRAFKLLDEDRTRAMGVLLEW